MPKLRFTITMSLDGYVAGPNQSKETPLGEGGEELHEWMFAVSTFRAMQGQEGGTTGPDDEIAREILANVGAVIMGRNMFGPIRGPWLDDEWRGWWGKNPPYHAPVFVLTHHARAPQSMEGGTTFHFVTDGVHSALAQAREAAGGKDISIGGGAETIQQFLREGLVDEMTISVVPRLLGDGARLFENTDGRQKELELVRVVSSNAVTHCTYRRSR